jgi:hypothetical protein
VNVESPQVVPAAKVDWMDGWMDGLPYQNGRTWSGVVEMGTNRTCCIRGRIRRRSRGRCCPSDTPSGPTGAWARRPPRLLHGPPCGSSTHCAHAHTHAHTHARARTHDTHTRHTHTASTHDTHVTRHTHGKHARTISCQAPCRNLTLPTTATMVGVRGGVHRTGYRGRRSARRERPVDRAPSRPA